MPGFYEITSSFVQMHLVVGQHHALLVDTGYGFMICMFFVLILLILSWLCIMIDMDNVCSCQGHKKNILH